MKAKTVDEVSRALYAEIKKLETQTTTSVKLSDRKMAGKLAQYLRKFIASL